MYVQDSHGIRTENIVEIVNEEKNEYGQFMGFRHLTYVPVDLDAIDTQYMEPSDLCRLNAYHRSVYEKLSPYFEEMSLKCSGRQPVHYNLFEKFMLILLTFI